MNYEQLTNGLAALTTASRQRNILLIAARNALLNEIGEPFVQFTISGSGSTTTVTSTIRTETERLLAALNSLNASDIRTAEADLAAIVANQTPSNPSTLSTTAVSALSAYGINTTNTRIRTVNTALNRNQTGQTASNVRTAIASEANRRQSTLLSAAHGQSTMAAGVDPSVQQSVRNLITRYSYTAYNTTAIEAARAGVERVVAAMTTTFTLPPAAYGAARNLSLTEQRAAARLALLSGHMPTVPGQHQNRPNLPNLNVEQILGLVWTAAHDRNNVLGPDQRPLTDNATNRAAINSAIADRERNFVMALIEYQTEYGGTDQAACAHGTYNKLVETLSLAHPDVVVFQQDLSNSVANEADRYIRNVIMPRVFRAQSNQEALHAALTTTTALSTSQQALLENFRNVMRQALRGELEGQESLYDALRTHVCPTIFTAGQYVSSSHPTQQGRVLNDLIPNWFSNVFEYSFANLPAPSTTAVPLRAPTASPAGPTPTQVPTSGTTTTGTTGTTTTTAAAVPIGYNPQSEARLGQFAAQNLQILDGRNLGLRGEIRISNVNMVAPYQAAMALPEMPVCFPYHPTGETDANARRDDGITAINAAIRLPAGTLNNLPTGVREALVQNGVNINNLEVNFCIQDMPWQNDQVLLRPHPFLHATAPQTGQHNSASNGVLVGISDINSPLGNLANVNLSTHGEGGAVVFSARDLPIQSVDPATGTATRLNTERTNAFYSLCINPTTHQAALTLHWLVNDTDHNTLLHNVIPASRSIDDIINNSAAFLNDTDLGNAPGNEISPIQALNALVHGNQPNLAQRPSRFRVGEQATLSATATATTGTPSTATVTTPTTSAATSATTTNALVASLTTGTPSGTTTGGTTVASTEQLLIAQLRAQMAALQTENSQLRTACTDLQNAMTGITTAYHQAEARATAANALVTQLQSSNSQLQTALANTNAAYQQAEARAAANLRRS
jgi:hypothetical protein